MHEATPTAELDLAAVNAQDAIVSDLKITVVDPSTGLEKTTTNLVGDTVEVEVIFSTNPKPILLANQKPVFIFISGCVRCSIRLPS